MLAKVLLVGVVCAAVWVVMTVWGIRLTDQMRAERQLARFREAVARTAETIGTALTPALVAFGQSAARAAEQFAALAAKMTGPEQ